jgi:acyl-CoA thioesterase-1
MPNILFLGDSLTAGYGLANVATESFPALIGQKTHETGLNYDIINAGISGDTSAGGLQRLGNLLKKPVAIFVLELGINDMMRGISPITIYNNLETIVKTVEIRYPEAKMALMGMQLPAFIPGAQVAEFRALYKKLADTYGMALVPFFLEGVAGQRHLNLRDGLHPSAAGYRIIADKVWPVLRPLL